MDIESFREYCLQKNGVTESFPFDQCTLAFKVAGKIFAITNVDNEFFSVNLKCDSEKAVELRATYSAIIPGYHMNKKLWNTIDMSSGEVPTKLFRDLIDHSYDEVVKKLPKKEQLALIANK